MTEGRVITISLSEFSLEQIRHIRPSKDNLPLKISRFLIVTGLVKYVPHFSTRLRIRIHAFRDVTKFSLLEVFVALRGNFLFPSSGLVTSFINFEDWADCFSIRSTYRYAPHNDVSGNNGTYIRGWSHKVIIL